jgi:ElaB/YqjD/DUF883 family membrane-anchored ribosome-binding protein
MENRDPLHGDSGMTPESTKSQPRGTTDTIRQTYDEAKQTAKNYASDAEDSVRDTVQQTREYVEDMAQQARDKISEYSEGGLERVTEDVTAYTRAQPMAALLIAAGLGLLIGWISGASRHR